MLRWDSVRQIRPTGFYLSAAVRRFPSAGRCPLDFSVKVLCEIRSAGFIRQPLSVSRSPSELFDGFRPTDSSVSRCPSALFDRFVRKPSPSEPFDRIPSDRFVRKPNPSATFDGIPSDRFVRQPLTAHHPAPRIPRQVHYCSGHRCGNAVIPLTTATSCGH